MKIPIYKGGDNTSAPARRPLEIAVGPHFRAGGTLAAMQWRWMIALVPTIAASVYYFGSGALRIYCLAVFFSLAVDTIFEQFTPSKDHTTNWTSVTFGILLALFLPINSPWWLIFIGCLLMIVVGKKLFGGWGSYVVHPVLISVAMLKLSWPERFDYTRALMGFDWSAPAVEPLRYVKSIGSAAEALYSWQDLALGIQVAGVGNGMVLPLLLGGLFLLAIREISWQLPCGFLGGLLITALLIQVSGEPGEFASPLFHLLSGSTVLAAFFLISDHPTSPVGRGATLLYAALGGMLVILIRSFSIHYDGIVFALILVNLTAPLFDRIARPVIGVRPRV